jgi:hypothetical protein
MANKRAEAGKNRTAGYKARKTPAAAGLGNALDNKDFRRGYNAGKREMAKATTDYPRSTNSRKTAAKKAAKARAANR